METGIYMYRKFIVQHNRLLQFHVASNLIHVLTMIVSDCTTMVKSLKVDNCRE